ncbi:MAG: TIGR03435 family protein [Acidobacteriota bacterium]|nr:TIGR03435 family protein [Acidobacteriota bacterium]
MKLRMVLQVTVVLLALGAVFAGASQAQDLAGNWQGTLEAGKGLRTILKVTKDGGKLQAQMFSVDQGGQPMRVSTISQTGTAVNFTIAPLDVTYAGTMNPDGNSISGSATQNGQTHTMNLVRVTPENMWPIPEPPKSMPADAKPKFDVVTVKPSDPARPGKLFTVRGRHIVTINTNVTDLVTFAYGLHPKQIVDAPEWFSDKFDVDGVPDVEGRPSSAQFRLLIADVLEQRFKLTFHHDQRDLPVYALEVAKGGPKMQVTADKPADARNFMFGGLGKLRVSNMSMRDFSDGMQGAVMDKPVVDHTGLTDRYDFQLNWTPDQSQFAQMGMPIPPPTDDPNAPPSLYTALGEQLGLKMEPMKAKADVIVIDHVEKPAAN